MFSYALLLTFTSLLRLISCDKPILFQATFPVEHGEGPIWDSRKELLYFVDLHAGTILSYDPIHEEINNITLHGEVTPVIPSKTDPDLLIVGLNRSVVAVEWDGRNGVGNQVILTSVAQNLPTSRFNDGKADKEGRLWFGTMGYENASGVVSNEGSLYFINRTNLKDPTAAISPVNVSNGMAWNKENNKFYYIDTPTKQIKVFDYNNENGQITNEQVAFDLNNNPKLGGYPDGMTIDEDDNLWIALYNGGAIIKVDPNTKQLLQVIAIPAQYVTSLSWGGTDLDTLYVTTSKYVLSKEERLRQPAAGSLFGICNLGTRGFPAFQADITDSILLH